MFGLGKSAGELRQEADKASAELQQSGLSLGDRISLNDQRLKCLAKADKKTGGTGESYRRQTSR